MTMDLPGVEQVLVGLVASDNQQRAHAEEVLKRLYEQSADDVVQALTGVVCESSNNVVCQISCP